MSGMGSLHPTNAHRNPHLAWIPRGFGSTAEKGGLAQVFETLEKQTGTQEDFQEKTRESGD